MGDSKAPVSRSSGKLTFISVGTKFRRQLDVLMEKLRSTVSVAKPSGYDLGEMYQPCTYMPDDTDSCHGRFTSVSSVEFICLVLACQLIVIVGDSGLCCFILCLRDIC